MTRKRITLADEPNDSERMEDDMKKSKIGCCARYGCHVLHAAFSVRRLRDGGYYDSDMNGNTKSRRTTRSDLQRDVTLNKDSATWDETQFLLIQ
jgi:hypothetical protein